MNPLFLFLIVILIIYVLITMIVGRYLLYQDIFPRKIPNGQTELVGYDYKDVEFKAFDGITLRGWFIKSQNNPSNKTIFLLPGWTKVRSKYISQIKSFVDSGFHVFTYDQRSHGASDTGLETYGPDEAKDLLEAIKYAGTFDSFDKDKIVAVGFSLGAFAIIYAAGNQIFKGVVLEGVASNSYDVGFELLASKLGNIIATFIGNGIFKVGSFIWTLGKFKHSSPIDYIGGVSPTPVMIIRGKVDERVPSDSFVRFMKKVKEPMVIWVHAGRHTSSYNQYPVEYSDKVLAFLNKSLETP